MSRLCEAISLVVFFVYGTTTSPCTTETVRMYAFVTEGDVGVHCWLDVPRCYGTCKSSAYLAAAVNTSEGTVPSKSDANSTHCTGVRNCCSGSTSTQSPHLFPRNCKILDSTGTPQPHTVADVLLTITGSIGTISYPTGCSCNKCESQQSSGSSAENVTHRALEQCIHT